MQFMMCEKQTRAEAEVVVLVGLHQAIGNAFKLVYLYRRLRCLHVCEAVQWSAVVLHHAHVFGRALRPG